MAVNINLLEISFNADDRILAYDALIAAEWMYHPYHFEMYQS